MSGTGNQYDYGFRIYNPRVAKFLSVDPLAKDYPWYTPYQFAGNKPIAFADLDGLEEVIKIYSQTASEAVTNYINEGNIEYAVLASYAMTTWEFPNDWHIEHYKEITNKLGWPEQGTAATHTLYDPNVYYLFIGLVQPDGELKVHKIFLYEEDLEPDPEKVSWLRELDNRIQDMNDRAHEYNSRDATPTEKWLLRNVDQDDIRKFYEAFKLQKSLLDPSRDYKNHDPVMHNTVRTPGGLGGGGESAINILDSNKGIEPDVRLDTSIELRRFGEPVDTFWYEEGQRVHGYIRPKYYDTIIKSSDDGSKQIKEDQNGTLPIPP